MERIILIYKFLLLFFLLIVFKSTIFSQNKWDYNLMYVSEGRLTVYSAPDYNSDSVSTVYYLDKLLVLKDEGVKNFFGWSYILYPQKGYVDSKFLLTAEEKHALDIRFGNKPEEDSVYNNWKAKIIFPKKDLLFVKEKPSFISSNAGVIRNESPLLMIMKPNEGKSVWINVIYPYEGYVNIEEVDLIEKSSFLSFGFTYSPLHIPIEKNMKSLLTPLGLYLEFTRTNWFISFGAGFSYEETHLEKYRLRSELAYIYLKFNLVSLFSNHLKIYALGGGGYWFSKFQNEKYPSLTDYFPLEKDKGIAYLGAAGMDYYLGGLFIGAEYFYWSSREAVFGPAPQPGEFTNQYKLFPGSNQLRIKLGYQFEF